MEQSFLLAPLEVSPAYEAVVARLSQAIALGFLVPGDRLPAERTLAEHLGVSRVTIREALRVLQGASVLSTRGGSSGWTVIGAHNAAGQPLITTLQGEATLEAVFEYRAAVESMTARLAAQRCRPPDLEMLARAHGSMESSASIGEFRRADSAFHLAVADVAANELIRRGVFEGRAAVFSLVDERPFEPRRASSMQDHAAILRAIGNGDADGAERAMREHLAHARDEVMMVLDSTTELPPPSR